MDKIDKYHWHEALDRTVMARDTWSLYIDDHPVTKSDPAIRELSYRVLKTIDRFSQCILEKTPNK